MQFTLTFSTDGDAFWTDGDGEVARILRDIATKIEADGAHPQSRTVRDINGNTVGTYQLTELA
jgi:hypothetical protein